MDSSRFPKGISAIPEVCPQGAAHTIAPGRSSSAPKPKNTKNTKNEEICSGYIRPHVRKFVPAIFCFKTISLNKGGTTEVGRETSKTQKLEQMKTRKLDNSTTWELEHSKPRQLENSKVPTLEHPKQIFPKQCKINKITTSDDIFFAKKLTSANFG